MRAQSENLLTKFVAYQVAMEAFRLTAIASEKWKGFIELRDQARGAAGSVTHNLAEGNGWPRGSKARHKYQRTALGSALELESALDDAANVGLGDPRELAEARAAAGRAARLCTGLVRPH